MSKGLVVIGGGAAGMMAAVSAAERGAQVTLLETADKWFGVTYKEDKPVVVKAIKGLIETGVYGEKLF